MPDQSSPPKITSSVKEELARTTLTAAARHLRDEKRREVLGVAAVIAGNIAVAEHGWYRSAGDSLGTAERAVNFAFELIAAVDNRFKHTDE